MAESTHPILDWAERPKELRAAVEFTAAQTGFVPALIEKDYSLGSSLGSVLGF